MTGSLAARRAVVGAGVLGLAILTLAAAAASVADRGGRAVLERIRAEVRSWSGERNVEVLNPRSSPWRRAPIASIDRFTRAGIQPGRSRVARPGWPARGPPATLSSAPATPSTGRGGRPLLGAARHRAR